MSVSDTVDGYLLQRTFLLPKEEARVPRARDQIRPIATKYDALLGELLGSLGSHSSDVRELVSNFGRTLLSTAIADRGGHNELVDDRPLYWARLSARVLLRVWAANLPSQRNGLLDNQLQTLEFSSRTSRGGEKLGNRRNGIPSILLTCFDPFKLDANIGQSNPSAAIALTLDGENIEGYGMETLVFPVRYADFDARIVEQLCSPCFIEGPRIGLTISMGRDQFDLERFPGLRRSSEAPDNAGLLGPVAGKTTPCIADSSEFVEFSLPAGPMCKVKGRWQVRDNRKVSTVEKGELVATSLSQLDGLTAISGSGGGYLSNEIAYRTRVLQQKLGVEFPLGHLHVPSIEEPDPNVLSKMVAQTRDLIRAALAATH
ncbi:MAG: hypothetical protein OXG08_04795 [Gammaproteobacteria bacterium]|nr:hypothetical protein [Gammaproteobacteria bacterium]